MHFEKRIKILVTPNEFILGKNLSAFYISITPRNVQKNGAYKQIELLKRFGNKKLVLFSEKLSNLKTNYTLTTFIKYHEFLTSTLI